MYRVTVNAQRYSTLLREKMVSCLHEKDALIIVTFTQNRAISHTANPVKEFLKKTLGEERIFRKLCKFSLPTWSLDMTPADF